MRLLRCYKVHSLEFKFYWWFDMNLCEFGVEFTLLWQLEIQGANVEVIQMPSLDGTRPYHNKVFIFFKVDYSRGFVK